MKDRVRTGRRPYRAILALVAAGLLAGSCTVFQGDEKRLVCPGISVLPEAGRMTVFKPGSGRDLIDVDHIGEVVGIKLTCDDEQPDHVPAVALVDILVNRGPASNPDRGMQVEVPYFVAVVDRTGAIRDKAVFRTSVEFAPGALAAGVREEVDVKISTADGTSPIDTGVMVGFQLSPEQYDYNRRQAEQ
jgi:hypothetical protein